MRKTDSISDTYLRQAGYTYFAFISYRHTDSHWATWLKRRLQAYRLPQRTQKRYRELPSRFSPVFLDKTNLTPGLLDEGLREEVQSSKFLIVICSRSAHDKSKYLDEEIQYFLDGGGDASRIIPFIVDDSPRPEEECFPLRLQELCREQTILGANVNDSGRRNAFLKVIAYMHGLKLEEIESDEARRRRKNICIASLVGMLALAGAAFGAYRYWDYNAPKTAYYQDYTERFGVPEGIGSLTEEEAASMASHYTIVSSRRKVRELRYENAHGQLLRHNSTAEHDRPTRALYEYAENDELSKVSWYGTDGSVEIVWNYSNPQTVDLQSEQSDSYVSSALLRANNPLLDEGGGPPVPENVARYLLDYDENGYVTELRYVGNPAYNDAASDPDGIGGLRYERDSLGRVTRLWYLNYAGERGSARYSEDYQIYGLSNGVAGIAFRYNDLNELEEYRYIGVGADGIRNSRGFCAAKLRYDERHNPIETRYFDTADKPVRQSGGFAVYQLEYNSEGLRIASRFLDTQEKPALNTDGYASAAIQYDSAGNMTQADFFGTDGKPVVIADGYARSVMEYNEDNRLIRQSCYGTEQEPVLGANGFFAQSWNYDALGRVIQTGYLGTDGKPCLCSDGCAEKQLELDDLGRCVRFSCFGTDGKPCLTEEGYSSFTQHYDEQGNLDELRFFGITQEPVLCQDGYAILRKVFDERGNPVSEHYYGGKEEPVLSRQGASTIEQVFDEYGNAVETKYLGTDGAPILLEENYAAVRQRYDRCGRCTEYSYYDTAQALCLNADGYAIGRRSYDVRGNLLRADYCGTDGAAILRSGGYSSVLYTLDINGQVTKTNYLGTDGEPVVTDEGYAGILYQYDEAGRLVTEACLDAAGELTKCKNGYAFYRIFYDDSGPIQADFYDEAGTCLGSQTEF